MAPRQLTLLALLGATLAAAWWVGREEEQGEVVEVVARPRQAAPGAPSPHRGSLPLLPSPLGGGAGGEGVGPQSRAPAMTATRLGATGPDLFPSQSWRPPPPPPAPAPPPPPPQAPPVPYKYLGRWQEDGASVVFLADGDRTRAARPGDRLGGQWRVDAVNGQTMTLTYLPLNQQRSLRLGP